MVDERLRIFLQDTVAEKGGWEGNWVTDYEVHPNFQKRVQGEQDIDNKNLDQ